jgi:hypothetical protein
MCLITLNQQEVDESEVGACENLLKECGETSFYNNTNGGGRFHMLLLLESMERILF